jgi:hypothetical protein
MNICDVRPSDLKSTARPFKKGNALARLPIESNFKKSGIVET